MAYPTLVSQVYTPWNQSNSNTTISGAIDTTGATDLRVWTICQSATAPTVSDSKSNTWAQVGTGILVKSGSNTHLCCFRATGTPVVGTGHTFTCALAGAFNHIGASAWKPTNAGNTLTFSTPTGNNDTSSPFATPSISPASDSTLVAISGDNSFATQTVTWSNSFTKVIDSSGANTWASSLATRNVTAGGPYSTDYTSTATITTAGLVIYSVTEVSSLQIQQQPASKRITDGDKAYLSLAAVGYSTAQWQDDRGGSFANCPDGTGATTLNYVSAALATGSSGRQYRCVLDGGALTSDPATVIVEPKTTGSAGQFDPDIILLGWW